MDVAAFVISVLGLLVAAGGLLWNEIRWRAERTRSVRVTAWHDGLGMDIYADRQEVEHVIAVRVVNLGERPEHVAWMGVESPDGTPIADDRPQAVKIVDSPAPTSHELQSRSQIGAQFKVPAHMITEGFVGYAALGTGERIYSAPATPEQGLGEIESMVQAAVAKTAENPDARRGPGSARDEPSNASTRFASGSTKRAREDSNL
ncbi:MAG TPA: hypothetical protein VEX36_04480 [Thermoleophilaceae bacterium]|nr:hypothetical protein [Thermoleophilaceae bacterium]